MDKLLFIGTIIFLAVVVDHVRFNLKVSDFIDAVYELATMYDFVNETLKKGGTDVEFRGRVFYMYVEDGNYESFVKQVEQAACELMDRYDRIGERYLSEMTDELYADVETYREEIQNVQNAVRITKWQNGWK